MTQVLRLFRRDARRVAVRAQLFAEPPPTELLEVVRHLGVVQADPTDAVAPSWSKTMAAAVDREISRLAGWLGLVLQRP